MRITKAEKAAISVTLVLLLVVGAFYLGRSTSDSGVVMETSPELSVSIEAQATMSEQAVESEPEISEDSAAEPESSVPETSETESPEEAMPEDDGILDLNTATAEQLEELPKIGPVLAERIIAYREEIGGFVSVEELKNVSGIGDKIFASIENLVEVVN